MSYYLRTVPLLMSALLLVHAHAARADELASSFLDSVVFTNVGYASGETVISNFPLKVDISSARPNGFDYDLAGANAASLRFNYYDEYVDAGTNAVVDTTVHFSITNWNDEGTSTLYVNVPRFSNSSKAKLTMYWNPADYAEIPVNLSITVPPAVKDSKQTAEWNQAIEDQEASANYIACGPAYRRIRKGTEYVTKLLNYWIVEPTISKTSWKQGEDVAIIDIGQPISESPHTTIEYFDRSDNSSVGDTMPVVPGSYRAVVTVAESTDYASLEYTLEFTIVSGSSVDGIAGTNDFAHSVTFSLDPTKLADTSLAPHFYANSTTKSLARSTYKYKTEVEASGAVTLGVWFKYDTSSARDDIAQAQECFLIGLCAHNSQQKGPLSILVDNYGARTKNKIYVGGTAGKDSSHTGGPYGADFASTTSTFWGDGKWHFVMASRTREGTVQLFVDGEFQSVDISSNAKVYDKTCLYDSTSGNDNYFAIGTDPRHNDYSYCFNGWFSEAMVYDKALTEAEMRAIYTKGERLTGIEDGLIGYFPMTDHSTEWEGSGATIADMCQNLSSRHDVTAAGYVKWEEPDPVLPFTGGLSILNGKPFLVLLEDDSPKGFTYDSLTFGTTEADVYSDLRFFDQNGEPLDYEIDLWDALGTSRIWVNVPKYTDATKIIMCWGQGAYTELPENDPDSVWAEGTTTQTKYKHRQYYIAGYGNELVTSGTVSYDANKQLQNRWITPPSLSVTQWKPGESAPTVVKGTSYSGEGSVKYYDRSTGKQISSLPVAEVGEYRAVFTVEETDEWSSLEDSINFRIVKELESHDLGDTNTRVLLANNDASVSEAEVYAQSYDDNEDGWGVPFWTHHEKTGSEDVSDFDSTKLFADFNLFPGTCHEYIETEGSTTNRLWGLVNVRFGNLFNNGRYHPGERGDTGLKPDQNYLPWNPLSERMLGYQGMQVGEYHRYAGTFVMQNVLDDRTYDYAQICSSCYDKGIGTIYFDVVNAFTNNVRDADGNANYAIVVEIATNRWWYSGTEKVVSSLPPVDGYSPNGIWSGSAANHEIYDAYRYADWKQVSMIPIRFRDNTGVDSTDCEVLPATTELELDVTEGGTAKNFYRVCVPLNIDGKVRFRIRRSRIDGDAKLNPDANSFIIVDNVICSKSRELLQLVPYGWFDPEKYGKQYLGQEIAFTPPFPGPKDAITGRVKVLDADGNEVGPGKITAVTMHYRWHYLEQRKSKWQMADFSPTTLTSIEPLILPGYPGDVDFWFEGSQNCGYYTYANYSGTKLGVPGYSESFALITNGWDGASSEWDIRIREGSSDYEGGVLIVREPGRSEDLEIPMELMESHQWRGYYQTTNAIAAGVQVRFELRNKQERGATEWATNTTCLYCSEKSADITPPYCGRLTTATTNDWTHVPVDAATGYLMFQIDDSSLGLTLVRADYQNFNHWTDGHGTVFVGAGSEVPASGTSPLTRDFTAYYNNRIDEVSETTNSLWDLNFETRKVSNYYTTFPAETETMNGWILGKGRFVYGNYRMESATNSTAFQMSGCGEGYVQMSNQSLGLWPRGVEKVTFSARLAQTIGFDDFSYVDDSSKLTNYTFYSHVAFDHDSNKSFTGNASLSMVAYYRRGVGCYEARWEQVKGRVDDNGIAIGIPADRRGQVLTIYRWNRTSSGYEQTKLAQFDNINGTPLNISIPETDSAKTLDQANMLPMSFAAYQVGGDTMLVVGFCATPSTPGTSPTTNNKWQYAAYRDNSADKLSSGAYGVLTANSPGIFACPKVAELKGVKPTWGKLTLPDAGKSNSDKSNGAYPSLIAFKSCYSDIKGGFWVSVPGRNDPFSDSASLYGFKAADVCQTVNLWASPATGTESYTDLLATFTISNHWGVINQAADFGADVPLVWRARDAKLRLRTGGDLDDQTSPGVVVDNVRVTQWRGKNEIPLYTGDSPDNTEDYTHEKKEAKNGDPDNYVYTGGWISQVGSSSQTVLELSAKRTIKGRPTGVRTPLMDGNGSRGSGIGNISFSYQNAQTNVSLLVQVATNVHYSTLEQLTKNPNTDTVWETKCRLTYEELGAKGSTNITFAIRNDTREEGYGCVARVIIDPDLVVAVSNVTDETAFGSIELLHVTCQDEPPIDKGCWWGWNLRTLGDSTDSEKRMYLPDASMRPDPGYSLALNNSVTDDIDTSKAEMYKRYMPFVQSPTFSSNYVGQLSFRARKYGSSDGDQAAEVAVYGITAKAMYGNGEWELLTRFTISNCVFTAYSYRADLDAGYCAFRLGVTGVKGVAGEEKGPSPQYGSTPVRVLLDEIVVCEAVNPELAFRNVGFFRSDMSGNTEVPNVPSKSEQPLAGEGWGVQCELYSVMLEDEIDMTTPPRVKLYWYEGSDAEEWGFDQWKDLPGAKSAWLERAKGTDLLIYRSSYDTCPDAVIPQSKKDPGGIAPVVQFMLEAYYTVVDPQTGAKTETTRLLDVESGEWEVPDWYAPLDYNTDYRFGDGKHWSCFCILDDIAPGWTWINEVNIFNFNPDEWDNDDSNCQFIEVAAPRDYDLTGWSIEIIAPLQYADMAITNTIAVFGENGLSGTKNLNVTSNYVFHVVANPDSYDESKDRSILNREGALDAEWNFSEYDGTICMYDDTITYLDSFGIRLVRPNGIVEHEIVTVGTNFYQSASNWMYSPTGVVAILNRIMEPDKYFYPGQDCGIGDHSVGVVNSQGEGPQYWNNTMIRTPGTINEDQQINPDYPVPQGEMSSLYLDLDQTGGKIWQSLDGGNTFTNESKRIYLKNNSALGTNITYKVEPWYEVEYVKQVNGETTKYYDVSNGFNRTTRTVTVNVGRLCEGKVNVTARATPDHQLKELGCDENNIYTPAVIDWLQKGTTFRGPFENDDGVLRLAEFWGLYQGFVANLTLTEMYWLDMDPTIGELVLKAGMSKPPSEVVVENYLGTAAVTNLRMSVFMMITNKTDNVASPHYSEAWTPYVLRAVEPGYCSTNYTAGSTTAWTSETFKISGILPNGHTSEAIPENWVDLRWFVFHEDSFHQPGNEVGAEPYTTDIEILDPMNSKQSPGYAAGWYDWVRDPEHASQSSLRPFFRWGLDTRLRPFEVEILHTNNYLSVTSP